MTYGKEIEGGTESKSDGVISNCNCLSALLIFNTGTDIDMACPYLGSPMHPFAFRVHAHDLGACVRVCVLVGSVD